MGRPSTETLAWHDNEEEHQVWIHGSPLESAAITLAVRFDVEGIMPPEEYRTRIDGTSVLRSDMNLVGSKLWIILGATYDWAVMSMSLYLRD